jgi:hypothetical protein
VKIDINLNGDIKTIKHMIDAGAHPNAEKIVGKTF